MAILDDMKLIGSLAVAPSGGGSATEYALVNTGYRRSVSVRADMPNAEQHSLRCQVAVLADNFASIRDAYERVRADLAGMGRDVTISVHGQPILYPAGPPASIPDPLPDGWVGQTAGRDPVVSIADSAETRGRYYVVDVAIDATVYGAATGGVVSHEFSSSQTEDSERGPTFEQRGVVVSEAGNAAKDEAETIVAALVAAKPAGFGHSVRYRETFDATRCEYTYQQSKIGQSQNGSDDVFLPAGLREANLKDSPRETRAGLRTRTITGSCVGEVKANAVAYANSIAPTPGVLELLTEAEVSEPGLPKGRVDFRYVTVTGTADTRFPNARIIRGSQTITRQSVTSADARSPIAVTMRTLGDPVLTRGARMAFEVIESTQIEYIGAITPDHIPNAAATANLVSEVAVPTTNRDKGIKSITLTRRYVFASPTGVTVADPLEIPA